MKNTAKMNVFFAMISLFIAVSCDKNDDNPSGITNEELYETIYQKMMQQGLLENQSMEVFISNLSSASARLNISETTTYDGSNDRTTTTIDISAKGANVDNLSVVMYVPKEVSAFAGDIIFTPAPTVVIEEDPLIMWHIGGLDDNGFKIYSVFKQQHSMTGVTLYITDNSVDDGLKYGDFAVTDFKYEDYSGRAYTVNITLGPEYREADWNDLEDYYDGGGDLIQLFNGLGLADYRTSVLIKRNGNYMYNDYRYYVASRHEHNKPESYLAHDNIDNYLISLGSWYNQKCKILAIKK